MDIAQLLRQRLRDALRQRERDDARDTNIGLAMNIGTDGSSTSVVSTDDVTIIDRNGERQVIRHERGDGPGDAPDDDTR